MACKMSEANTAQCVYSPEGILDVRFQVDELASREIASLEYLSSHPGVSLHDERIRVEVERALGNTFGFERNERLATFLAALGNVLPWYDDSGVDRVYFPTHLDDSTLNGAVQPTFQRWLNAQDGCDELVAKETLTAMALPFGKEAAGELEQLTMYRQSAGAGQFAMRMHTDEDFEVYFVSESADSWTQHDGTVQWTWVSLSTLAGAYIGVDRHERQHINVGAPRSHDGFYEMTSGDVDVPQQTLSLLLGIGALASHASKYEGQEDLLEGAVWREPLVYPKESSE